MSKINKNIDLKIALKNARNRKLTDEEIDKAFKIWYRKHHLENIDRIDSDIWPNPELQQHKSWLQTVRQSLLLSAKSVADKLNVSRAAYSKYEDCEKKGVITLATISKAAEAMDCDFVYAIVPKNKKHFSEHIWQKLLPVSIVHPWIKNCDPNKKAEALAFIAGRNLSDPKIRKQLGWSQKLN